MPDVAAPEAFQFGILVAFNTPFSQETESAAREGRTRYLPDQGHHRVTRPLGHARIPGLGKPPLR